MKAVVIRAYGGPDELKFEDRPDPIAGPGEVRINVAATSVYPFDIKLLSGRRRVLRGSSYCSPDVLINSEVNQCANEIESR